jgi:hypothetical protein
MAQEREPTNQELQADQIPQTEEEDSSDTGVTIDPKDPRTRWAIYKLIVPLATVAGIGGAVSFFAGQDCGFQEARKEAVQMLGEKEFKVEPSERRSVENEVSQDKLLEWQEVKRIYQRTFDEAVKFDNSNEIIEPLRQLAIGHTFYGAELVNRVFYPSKFEVDYESNKLTFNGTSYDLSQPREFHLASAIVDVLISRGYWSREVECDDPNCREEAHRLIKEADEDLGNLSYVSSKINNIYFTQESFLYFPKELFVAISKITKTLENHGYPQPKTIIVAKASEDSAGTYVEHDNPNSPNTIILRGNSYDFDIIHEYGHFLLDTSHYDENSPTTQKTSIENYRKIVEVAQILYGNQATDLQNHYVSDYAQKSIKEDYAETFAWYFWRGDDLRAKLEELKTKDPVAYEILKTKYDFFKNVVFEGEEFHNKGVSFVEETQKTTEAETKEQVQTNYQIGDLVRIVDEDQGSPGILLRPQPIAGIDYKDQSWPAVFNGDEVEIIGGPEEIIRYIFNYETNQWVEVKESWWEVKISWQGTQSYRLLGWKEGEGWISEIWFDEKVTTRQ